MNCALKAWTYKDQHRDIVEPCMIAHKLLELNVLKTVEASIERCSAQLGKRM